MVRSSLLSLYRLILLSCIAVLTARAQVTSVTGELTLPVPGAGHDYVQMLNETVNPVNGAVSIRISVPVPPGRGLTVPFSFGYDSNSAHHFVMGASGVPSDNASYLAAGGWSYLMPYLTMVQHVYTKEYSTSPPQFSHCYYYTDFLFTDLNGKSDTLGLSTAEQNGDGPCVSGNMAYGNWLAGAGTSFEASAADGSTTKNPTAVTVSELDGTVYYFSNSTPSRVHPTNNSDIGWASLPDWIEDRNGNKVTISDSGGGAFAITDTLGRLLSSSGFKSTGNTITVSGFANPYRITWGSASTSTAYNTKLYYSGLGGACTPAPAAPSGSFAEITQIQVPNGQTYQFQYDANAGVVSKIIYPNGGYVRYVWGKNSLSDSMDFLDNVQTNTSPNCHEQYDTQAVTDRYVSFNGTTEVLHQHFSYGTTWSIPNNWPSWTGKTTTVTTYDLVRGTNFSTVYNYTPSHFFFSAQPNDPITYSGNTVPVESSVVYYNTSGSVLKTVSKAFVAPDLTPDEKTTLDNGETSQITRTYLNLGTSPPQPCSVSSCSYGSGVAALSDEYDYDFGAGTPGTVLKHSHFDYNTLVGNSIGGLLLETKDHITYDGAGNRAAETDYGYDQTSVSSVPSLTGHDDTNFSSSYNARGNETTVTEQCFQGSQSCTNAVTTYAYDETGHIVSQTDPCGNTSCADVTGSSHTSTYNYADRYTVLSGGQNVSYTPSGDTNAYLTSITDPLGHTQQFTYDFTTGELTVSKDQNSQVSTYLYNDSLARPTQEVFPDQGQTSISYNDAGSSSSVTISKLVNSNTTETKISILDGLGHIVRAELTSDPNGTVYTDTTYDGMGRPYTVSNPYYTTSDTTYGVTTYAYDALGRRTTVQNPDSTTRTTAYTGRATLDGDEGNGTRSVQRISQADGLGRTASVCEVTSITLPVGSNPSPSSCGLDISGTGFVTTYSYDTLDDLLSVAQGSLSGRSFTYDSLSRVTSTTDPELGTISYKYDANGNVSSKTAPLPNQTNPSTTVVIKHTYDVLNRVTSTWYTDSTPSNYYAYDQTSGMGHALSNTIGRMTSESRTTTGQNSQYVFSYDSMGRVINEWRCTPLNCGTGSFSLPYTYDYAGNLTSAGNGENVVITYGPYNGANEPTAVTSSLSDSNHPGTLMNNFYYDALGKFITAGVGNDVMYEYFTYSNRRVPTSFWACTGGPGPCNSQTLLYTYAVNGSSGLAPNGDFLSVTDTVNGNWTYAYDDFNRLSTAVGSTGLGCSWDYDRYGNRWHQNTYQGSCTTPMFSFTGNNNRIDGYSYDAAGNLLNDGVHNYTYDAENRLIQVDGGNAASYVYDPEGMRIQKTGGGTTVNYLYDLDGHQITEVGSGGTWNRGEVYADGLHLATYRNSTTYFNFADWLGTERSRATVTGQVCETIASLPFGDNQVITGSCADTSPMHFTGKPHDSESGEDYFGARYYSSVTGRWIHPDASLDGTILELPQSWNKYAYEYNRPLYGTDPDGHCPPCIGAIIGGVIEGSFDLGKQLYNNGGHLSNVSWGEVGANALGGAVSGAIAGATGGASIVANEVVGDLVAGSTSNVIGGVVTRALDPNTSSEDVLSGSNVVGDAVSGLVGGGVGHVASASVHIPEEPTFHFNGRNGHVNNQAYHSALHALAARNTAAFVNQGARAGVASSFGTHGFDWIKEWLFSGPHCHTEGSLSIITDGFGNIVSSTQGRFRQVCD